MSETPTLLSLYIKWTNTETIRDLVTHLQTSFPEATDLERANHALHFAQAHMTAYLVSAINDVTEPQVDPDRPSWL